MLQYQNNICFFFNWYIHFFVSVQTIPHKSVRYKTVRKTVPTNHCFNKPVGREVSFVQQTFLKNSDRRSRASVLRARQQRVGLNTKFRAGYRCKAARAARPLAILSRTVLYWTVFFSFVTWFFGIFCLGLFCMELFCKCTHFWRKK